MQQFIETWGKLAQAIGAIIALLTLILFKPIMGARKRRAAEMQVIKEFRVKVLAALETIGDDVGDLQCDRLNQAHDYYVEKGCCPTERKAALCAMYQSYHNKGRNHLSAHYEKEIMELPDHIEGKEDCQ